MTEPREGKPNSLGVTLREFIEHEIAALKELFELQIALRAQALEIQAGEYERRLTTLNHAHEKAIEVQHTYVTQDKYDDRMQTEEKARELAVNRIDEKFNEHIKRYEARHEELREQAQTLVTRGYYDEKLEADRVARELALDRVNEQFADYVKRYEQRQREVDLLLQAQANATNAAERAADKAASDAKDAAADTSRRTNRNMTIGGLLLTAVVVAMNLIGAI